jgi:hypothetical protein
MAGYEGGLLTMALDDCGVTVRGNSQALHQLARQENGADGKSAEA